MLHPHCTTTTTSTTYHATLPDHAFVTAVSAPLSQTAATCGIGATPPASNGSGLGSVSPSPLQTKPNHHSKPTRHPRVTSQASHQRRAQKMAVASSAHNVACHTFGPGQVTTNEGRHGLKPLLFLATVPRREGERGCKCCTVSAMQSSPQAGALRNWQGRVWLDIDVQDHEQLQQLCSDVRPEAFRRDCCGQRTRDTNTTTGRVTRMPHTLVPSKPQRTHLRRACLAETWAQFR